MSVPAPRSTPKRVLVAGLGNPDRGDDGFGPAVVSRLARIPLPDVDLVACRRPLDLLDLWEGRRRVLVIDAALPQGKPGRLHRLNTLHRRVPRTASASTHSLGLAQTIELGRSMGLFPGQLILYAVEALGFTHGAPLSLPVAAAVEEVARRVARECGGR